MPSFIVVGYVWQILGRGGPFLHEQPRKSPSWIGLIWSDSISNLFLMEFIFKCKNRILSALIVRNVETYGGFYVPIFFRILNLFAKVFKLPVLFLKEWKNLSRKCADACPNAEISHHTICKIAVFYRAICKIATSYCAICKIANFYRAIWKIAVFYRATCKIAVFHCAICRIVVFYFAIYKIAVSYRAICKIAT